MCLRNREKLYSKKAFSLIELMIACLIIAVLVGLAAPSYLAARFEAEEKKAIVTLYEYAQGQKEFWFAQNPNTYASVTANLVPSFIDVAQDDGDWTYIITGGDATTFTITAQHLDVWGAQDGLSLSIDQTGSIDDTNWPY